MTKPAKCRFFRKCGLSRRLGWASALPPTRTSVIAPTHHRSIGRLIKLSTLKQQTINSSRVDALGETYAEEAALF